MPSQNSFGAAGEFAAGGRSYQVFRLPALEHAGITKLSRLPYSIKVLLENLLRFEDGVTVKASDIEYVAR
jgi:aconitate hydratase